MSNDISKRISAIRDTYCGGSNTEMARVMGVSPQQVSNLCRGYRSAGAASRRRILTAFPMVREQWLLAGAGTMTEGEHQSASLELEVAHLRDLLAERERTIQEQTRALEDLRILIPVLKKLIGTV